ncbi:MAG: 4-hydroxy-tetrahydrodipicolinate synthase [Gaiellales bacterium]|nr:4-hydroxy-tetrahydrodipicolinate synthase [Gaiellales bacterium]
MTPLTGLVPPIATPFRDGSLDLASFTRLVDHLAGHVSGYLVGGSVGEVPSLTLEERAALMREAARCRPAGHTLAVSISDNSIVNSRRLSEVAGEVGADVLMLSCPNYFGNSLEMLIEYFGAAGEFASADICLYDNPLASHTVLSVGDIARIAAAVPRVTHVKVTDTAIDKVAALREATALVILAGDDAVIWNQLARGVDGAMVALPMIAPEAAAELWSAYARGALDDAFAAYARVAAFLHSSLGAPDYVAVIKTVLQYRGVIDSGELRLPLLALAPARRAEVLAALEAV